MEYYYAVVRWVFKEDVCFCVWYIGDDESGFLSREGRTLVFRTENAARDWAAGEGFSPDDKTESFDAGDMEAWALDKTSPMRGCEAVINFWNIAGDAAGKVPFLGKRRTKEMDALYDKLFFGTNPLNEMPACAAPAWSKRETALAKKVVLSGVEAIRAAVQNGLITGSA